MLVGKVTDCGILFTDSFGIPANGEPMPHLMILPSQPVQIKALGKSALLTCRANVENADLVQDMKWIHPNGRTVLHDRLVSKQFSEI